MLWECWEADPGTGLSLRVSWSVTAGSSLLSPCPKTGMGQHLFPTFTKCLRRIWGFSGAWFEPNPLPTSPGRGGSRADKSRCGGTASSPSSRNPQDPSPRGLRSRAASDSRCRAGQRPFPDGAPGRSKLEPSGIPVSRRGCGRRARPARPLSRSRGHLMTLITRSMAVVKAISANRLWKCSRWGTARRNHRGWGTPGFSPAFFP